MKHALRITALSALGLGYAVATYAHDPVSILMCYLAATGLIAVAYLWGRSVA